MRHLAKAAAALAAATTLAVPAPADATSVCIENNQLTFTPPLDLENRSGTVTLSVQGTCAGSPLTTASTYSGTFTFDYFGSCALAFIAEGGQSVMVGGTFYAYIQTNRVKAEVTVPNAVCPIARASGTGVRITP